MKAVAYAAIASIAIQPLLFFAWFFLPALVSGAPLTAEDIGGVVTWVAFVATAFVLLLGIPAFLLLQHFNRASWASLAGVGFLLPALPLAIVSWPSSSYAGSSYSGTWHGHVVDFVVNGVPTLYGWLDYVQSISLFGFHGLLGALVFFSVWRKSSPNYALKRTCAE